MSSGLGLGTTSTAVLRQGFISANTAVSVTQASEFQSGHKVVKKGSEHLILCISLTNRGIQCIEITQNTQILKIADFAI